MYRRVSPHLPRPAPAAPCARSIKDNPVPVEFPISVIGAKPQVLAYLNDGSPPPDPTKQPPAPNRLLTEGVQVRPRRPAARAY